MILKWLFSRTVRHALQMRKHVWKILQHQRDLLTPQAIGEVQKSMNALRALCAGGDRAAIQAGMAELEQTANQWLKPYPYASYRENIEVLLVAIAVAMAIRTFFLQPFKIPTGSMQPTLWGIWPTVMKADERVPNRLVRLAEFWIRGVGYEHVVARSAGSFEGAEPPTRLALFNLKQRFKVGGEVYTLWFPADSYLENLGRKGYWYNSDGSVKVFQPGDEILKMKVASGDHLFVDRLTYNFRPPQRGEIVVFETKHISHQDVPTDQFYIKRLVGLGSERLKIGPDQRLVVNGKPLTPSTPHFENLYSFMDGPRENQYFGHVGIGLLAHEQEYAVPPNQYVVMGDNTLNSLDSRYWGAFPREDVIGKAYFVYWPITSRFGWGYR
ncbi:MAG: signal peptidase I [Verrucomicrobia bacterium]|nr:signal peptidase I [Verrucomicrobiota bacterium]